MRNIARLPENDRRELFRNTADKMGLNDAIVEKILGMLYTGLSVPSLSLEKFNHIQGWYKPVQGV